MKYSSLSFATVLFLLAGELCFSLEAGGVRVAAGGHMLMSPADNATAPPANWTTQIGFEVVLYPIEIGRDNIFIGGGSTVMALDKDTGDIIWNVAGQYDVSTQNTGVPMEQKYFPSTSAGGKDVVVFCTAGSVVVALDASNGNELWTYNASHNFAVYGYKVGTEWIVLTLIHGNWPKWTQPYVKIHVPTGVVEKHGPIFGKKDYHIASSMASSVTKNLLVAAGKYDPTEKTRGVVMVALQPNATQNKWERRFDELYIGVYQMWFTGDGDKYILVIMCPKNGDNTAFVLDSETGATVWTHYKPHEKHNILPVGSYVGSFEEIGVFLGTAGNSTGVDLRNGTILWSIPYQPIDEWFFDAAVTEDGRYLAYIGPDTHEYHWAFSIYNVRDGSLEAYDLVPFPGRGAHKEIHNENPLPPLVGDTFYYSTVNEGFCAAAAHGNPVKKKWCTGASYELATSLTVLFEKTHLFFTWYPSPSGYISCYRV